MTRETALRARARPTRRPRDAAATKRRAAHAGRRLRDLARLFPASGVGDKALWQGGMLAGRRVLAVGDEPVDRATALRVFEALRTTYPVSS